MFESPVQKNVALPHGDPQSAMRIDPAVESLTWASASLLPPEISKEEIGATSFDRGALRAVDEKLSSVERTKVTDACAAVFVDALGKRIAATELPAAKEMMPNGQRRVYTGESIAGRTKPVVCPDVEFHESAETSRRGIVTLKTMSDTFIARPEVGSVKDTESTRESSPREGMTSRTSSASGAKADIASTAEPSSPSRRCAQEKS